MNNMRTKPDQILINEFDYQLPQHHIAHFPIEERDHSKLLVYKEGKITDAVFKDVAEHLPPHSAFILNNTKVIEARLFFEKETGGVIEIFCLEPYQPASVTEAMAQTATVQWQCLIGGASKWKPGLILQKQVVVKSVTCRLSATYIAKKEDSFIIEFTWDGEPAFGDVLQAAGAMPLPPYIKRKSIPTDADRYQTIFAQHKGSVAAPTAALHVTPAVFQALLQKDIRPSYITLHVGAGTFKPVKSESIADHKMHAESFSVSAQLLQTLIEAETIIAVGTTTLRTLESLYWLGIKLLTTPTAAFTATLEQWEPYELEEFNIDYKEALMALLNYLQQSGQPELYCRTSLIIIPSYNFKSAKALITNFHQPRSTLLLLVAAFIGDDWKKVYQHAVENEYRFLSYGDSSLLYSPHSNLPLVRGRNG